MVFASEEHNSASFLNVSAGVAFEDIMAEFEKQHHLRLLDSAILDEKKVVQLGVAVVT